MRAATRKQTEQHKDEMAIRAAKRDLRRRRRIGTLVSQAKAREMSRMIVEAAAGKGLEEGVKPCVPVDCSQTSED